MVTGMRGLCNGLGPAMFGLIFYMFHVDLNDGEITDSTKSTDVRPLEIYSKVHLQHHLFFALFSPIP